MSKIALTLVLASLAWSAGASAAAAAPIVPEKRAAFLVADNVVVGVLTASKITGVAEVVPPVYGHHATLAVERILVGQQGVPGSLEIGFESREHKTPLPTNQKMLFALRRLQEDLDHGGLRFAVLGMAPWSEENEKAVAGPLAPEGLRFAVTPFPPVRDWVSERFSGLVQLTLENVGAKAVAVPGLNSNGKQVDWAQALQVRTLNTPYLDQPLLEKVLLAPKSDAVKGKVEPLTLEPGASVSHVVDVFALGIVDLLGGGHYDYAFAIGGLRSTVHFYLYSSLEPQPTKAAAPECLTKPDPAVQCVLGPKLTVAPKPLEADLDGDGDKDQLLSIDAGTDTPHCFALLRTATGYLPRALLPYWGDSTTRCLGVADGRVIVARMQVNAHEPSVEIRPIRDLRDAPQHRSAGGRRAGRGRRLREAVDEGQRQDGVH
ncbi:MAG: hypothetical protein QM765_32180 [Myxococcales bacterium]